MKHLSKTIAFSDRMDASLPYTCVSTIGKKVYARQRTRDGFPIYAELDYHPTYYQSALMSEANGAESYALDGTGLYSQNFDSIYDAKKFIDDNPGKVYGDIQCEYMALADTYGSREVVWDMDHLYLFVFDIEVARDPVRGYAPTDDPFNPVTLITVKWAHEGKTGIVVYGCRDGYTPGAGVTHYRCADEADLLQRFIADLRGGGDYPDILTGWNIQFFDIPYLVNRCKVLFPEEEWIQFSPFQRIQERRAIINHHEQLAMDIQGLAIMDYYELYRKFTMGERENYRLDYIAHLELGKRKVSYQEVRGLNELMDADYQKFVEYGIRDVELVFELDAKMKLIELACAIAYNAKANFADTFKQVRLWDIMIYHDLRAQNIQIPPRIESDKNDQYAGAYVKEPVPGMYNWVVSFDVASMYPHIIREWNLSPEMKVTSTRVEELRTLGKSEDEVRAIVDKLLADRVDVSIAQRMDCALTANGLLMNRTREGFLPRMLKTLYDERVKFKTLQKKAKQELERVTVELNRRKREKTK